MLNDRSITGLQATHRSIVSSLLLDSKPITDVRSVRIDPQSLLQPTVGVGSQRIDLLLDSKPITVNVQSVRLQCVTARVEVEEPSY